MIFPRRDRPVSQRTSHALPSRVRARACLARQAQHGAGRDRAGTRHVAGESANGAFLYVEVGMGWITPSVFKADGKVVRYVESEGSDLELLLLSAWFAEPASRRWSIMEYDLKNGAFSVAFQYPDEVDVEAMHPYYREKALLSRFGDRPLVFPQSGQAGRS
ncbi:hypothetical protein [Sphingomonas xinjiangensis]|uniref:Uncharacterized protein n=1 Tax=Sphingomonas xinjiangensis TaxID=643568 RepID=A0A840YQZ0_9SPHN|nr:hypothetical protein [Sphingomonas xinjiangensis]MBB5711721.1 hypothetical protein [Sphingomonas xinjiangensis]